MKIELDSKLGDLFKHSFYKFYRQRSGNDSWEPGFNHANSDIVSEWDKMICNMGCSETSHDVGLSNVHHMEDYLKIIHPYRGRLIFVPMELALKVKILGYLPINE